MSNPTADAPRRTVLGRVVAATGVAAAVAGTLMFANSANAASSTMVHITAVTPHYVAAGLAKQVLTITGTGFDEANIASISIDKCTTDPNYIVTSATTVVVKTAGTDCAAGNAIVTITDTASTPGTAVSTGTGTQALTFVTPPKIATASATVRPVFTDNTAGSYAMQSAVGTSASTKGGAVVRVLAAAGTTFATSSATPLSASLDGVAMTGIKVVGSSAGNYFTGVLGAAPADASPTLKITNGGATATFRYGAGGASATDQTFDFTLAGSTISVSPAFGPSAGGNTLSISGSGFSTTAANDVVTIGGVSCPVSGTPTATSIKCTVAAATTPFVGPQTVQVAVTGGLTSVVSPGSTYTFVAQ